jgi:hypothetical protein
MDEAKKTEYMMKKRKDGTFSILRKTDSGPVGMFHKLDKKAADNIMKKLEGGADARDRRERGMPDAKGQRLFASFQEHVEFAEEQLDEMSAKAHYKTYQAKFKAPPIDRDRYPNREAQGLEGPFQTKKTRKIFYYDKKAGKYYDPDTDMYLQVSDIMEDVEQVEEKFEFQFADKETAQKFMREVMQKRLGNSTGTRDGQVTTMTNSGRTGEPTMAHKEMAKIMKKHGGKLTRTDEGPSLAKIFEETVELDENIVSDKVYRASHGKKPNPNETGGWYFGFSTHPDDIVYQSPKEMKYKDAKKEAEKVAKEKGLKKIYVMDSYDPELDESRKRIGIKTIKFAKILGLSKAAKDVFASAINMSQTAGVPGMDAPLATADNLQKFSDGDFVGALVYLRKNSSKLPAGGRKYAKEILDALGDEITEQLDEDGHTDVASAKMKVDIAGKALIRMKMELSKLPNEASLPSWWTDKVAIAVDKLDGMADYLDSVVEDVQLDEAVDQKQLLTMYKKLKKGDKIDVTFDSSIRKGKEPMTLVVTSPHRVVGKAKVGRIIFKDVENMGGVKYFWYNRDDKISMAQGDMAVSPREVKMSTDEGFASDAQRRAAFASGYKAKGKKGKKEETELEESTPEYRAMMKKYKGSDMEKVFDILDKHGYRLGEQGDTLVRNMLKKFKGDVKKAAAFIMKSYPSMKKEDVQLDETNFRFPQPGEYYGDLAKSISDDPYYTMSKAELKKRSDEVDRKFAVVMRKHRGTKVGEVLDLLDKDGGRKLYKDSDIKQIGKYLTKFKDNVRKVAHQMMIDYMEGDDYLAKKRIPVKEDVQEGKKMKVKLDPNKSMDKVVKTLEDKMTDAEMDKREKIVKSMKKKKDDFKARYGDQADDVMYATATKMAMKDSYELEDGSTINESFESEFPTSQVETLAANMTPVVRDRWVIKEAPFDDIKKIVADKSMMTVKFPDGKQKVDMMTANVLMTVYDALNDKNKKKFVEKINAKLGNFLKLVQFAYSAVNPK